MRRQSFLLLAWQCRQNPVREWLGIFRRLTCRHWKPRLYFTSRKIVLTLVTRVRLLLTRFSSVVAPRRRLRNSVNVSILFSLPQPLKVDISALHIGADQLYAECAADVHAFKTADQPSFNGRMQE